MLGSKTVDNIKAMTTAVNDLKKAIDSATQSWSKFGGAAKGASGGGVGSAAFSSSAGMGMLGLGSSGSTLGLGTSGATFSGLQMLGRVAQVGLGVAGAVYGAAPDTGSVISRAAGYYSAATFGGVNRTALARATFSGLAGGVTSLGSDAAISAALTRGYNMMPGSTAYNMTVAQIGGAARYMNMSNESAAMAIGGMYTGSMGGNLYQYGIHTIDPRTGKQLSMSNIAQQLYGRMFGGRKVSASDVAGSLQMGFAGANLRNMGFSSDQQQILSQMFMDIAQGKNPDLASKPMGQNPLAAQMKITTSETSLMQSKEQAYIQGMNSAADAIAKVNDAMKGWPDIIYQTKAAMQTFFGSNVGGGSNGAGLAVAGAAGWIARGFRSGASTAAGDVSSLITSGGKTIGEATGLFGKLGAGFMTGIKALSGAGEIFTLGSAALKQSSSSSSLMQSASAWEKQHPNASMLDRVTNALSNLPNIIARTVKQDFGIGGGSSGFGASFGPAGGAFSAEAPVNAAPTTMFGAKNPKLWKNGHTGQDYPVPKGTPVHAAADGTVIDSDPSPAYGINVMIDHGNGYQTLYGHLSEKSVSPGNSVSKGQVIGKSGDTGNVTGPHLHFEVRKGKNNPVDPQQFLNGSLTGGSSAAGSGSGIASVLGGMTSIDLTGGYNLASNLFSGATTSTMKSSDPNAASSGSSTGTGSAAFILGTGNQKQWATKLLSQLGDPVTPENLKALTTWMAWEGGHWKNSAHYNPLNTTQPESGSSSMNNEGVQSYNSWAQGLQATIQTLRNGRYGNILSALSSGTDAAAVLKAVDASPWGTKIPGYGGGSTGFGASLPSSSGASPIHNVTINVTLSSGSDEEALKFAKKVKQYLATDNETILMGSK